MSIRCGIRPRSPFTFGRSGCPTQRPSGGCREAGWSHSGCYDASSCGEPAICERNDRLWVAKLPGPTDASWRKLRVESEISLENRGLSLQPKPGRRDRTECITPIKKGDTCRRFYGQDPGFKRPGDPNKYDFEAKRFLNRSLPVHSEEK